MPLQPPPTPPSSRIHAGRQSSPKPATQEDDADFEIVKSTETEHERDQPRPAAVLPRQLHEALVQIRNNQWPDAFLHDLSATEHIELYTAAALLLVHLVLGPEVVNLVLCGIIGMHAACEKAEREKQGRVEDVGVELSLGLLACVMVETWVLFGATAVCAGLGVALLGLRCVGWIG